MGRGVFSQVVVAALLIGSLAAAAPAQGTGGEFPRPLGLGGLRELLRDCPLDQPTQWTAIMDAHAAYLEQSRRLRDGEIAAQLESGSTRYSPSHGKQRQMERTRISLKLQAAEQALFDQVQLVLGDSAAGVIKSARRGRERQMLLQMYGNFAIQVGADVVSHLLELPLEGEERARAMTLVEPVEEQIVAALRQMPAAFAESALALRGEMKTAGVAEDWFEQSIGMTAEEREELKQRADQAWHRAGAPIRKAEMRVIAAERAGLRRLIEVLSPRMAARLQRAYYEIAYEELPGLFSGEVELQARQALRYRSLNPSESEAIRGVFASWLAAESVRAAEAADVIDSQRQTGDLDSDWHGDDSVELRKLRDAHRVAAARAVAAINAILGPDRAANGALQPAEEALRPLAEIALIGLEEADAQTAAQRARRFESGLQRSNWAAPLEPSEALPTPLARESLPSLGAFLGLSPDAASVVAILLETAELEQANIVERWRRAEEVERGPKGVAKGTSATTSPISDDAEEARLRKGALAERAAIRAAAWNSQNNLWDDAAALLPEEERWRVEFVRITRALNQRRVLNRDHWGDLSLRQVQPDLAEVVRGAGLSPAQLQAFCQAAIGAADALALAVSAVDRCWDEEQVGSSILLRRARSGEEAQARELWGRLREERQLREGQIREARSALHRQIQSTAEAAAEAATVAGASREWVMGALCRSAWPGIWDSALDLSGYIARAGAEAVRRAAGGDSNEDTGVLAAGLEAIRSPWVDEYEACCQRLVVIATRLAELSPARDGGPDAEETSLLRQNSHSLAFYRDENALHALERIALVLGEDRGADFSGFNAALNRLRERSARPVDW